MHNYKKGLDCKKILADMRYQTAVSKRYKWALSLSLLVIITYFSLILSIAFFPEWLSIPVAKNSFINIGILWGGGVIVFSVLLTGIYHWASTRFLDKVCEELSKELAS